MRLLAEGPETFSRDRLNVKQGAEDPLFYSLLDENTSLFYVPPRKKKGSCHYKMPPDFREGERGRGGEGWCVLESVTYAISKPGPGLSQMWHHNTQVSLRKHPTVGLSPRHHPTSPWGLQTVWNQVCSSQRPTVTRTGLYPRCHRVSSFLHADWKQIMSTPLDP